MSSQETDTNAEATPPPKGKPSRTLTKKLKLAWRILKWLGCASLLYYLVLAQGWKDIPYGRFIRQGETMFSETSGITEVRVYLLHGKEDQRTGDTFPVRSEGTNQPVYGEVRLTGAQLEEFLSHWRVLEVSPGHGALCHEPAYGFRFYKGGWLAKQTDICWDCRNFSVDMWPLGGGLYEFNATSKRGQEMLKYCDKLLPLPKGSIREPAPGALELLASQLKPKAGQQPSPITLTAQLVTRDDKHYLAFHLTNVSTQPLEVYPCMLPWGVSSDVGLAAVTADGTVLSTVFPISDPPFEHQVTLAPGESRDGEWQSPLGSNISYLGFYGAQDILVTWSYRLPSGSGKPYAPCTGTVVVPKRS